MYNIVKAILNCNTNIICRYSSKYILNTVVHKSCNAFNQWRIDFYQEPRAEVLQIFGGPHTRVYFKFSSVSPLLLKY